MKRSEQEPNWTRRRFLEGAGLLGLGSAVTVLSPQPVHAAAPASRSKPAPAGIDFERFRKTDPALVHYELAATLRSPRDEPRRIAMGPDGILWVTAGPYLMGLDKQGIRTVEWMLDEDVRSVAVAPDGAVLAGLKDRIAVFDAKGRKQAGWPLPSPKAWLVSLAAGPQDVFASDATAKVVYRFDRTGTLRGKLGEKDKKRAIPAFLVPSPYFDLEIEGDNRLWVVNPGLHQFQAFRFDGTLEKTWGEASFAVAGFCGCCNPSYFTRLADGRFVTSEKGMARVKVYSPEGRFESVVAGPEAFPKYFENVNATPPAPMDVAADASGRIYVADILGNQIRVYARKPAA